MRRVVISHSQLPKRPQVSLFHTQTNQKLNGKLVMLSGVQDLSLPCCSHPAFVTAELRNSSPGAPLAPWPHCSCPALSTWSRSGTRLWLPGVGTGACACESWPETSEHCESPEYLSRLGWFQFGDHTLIL